MRNNSTTTYMKKFIALILVFTAFSLALSAQDQRRGPHFSPRQFQAEMEQFIVREACLSPQEAAAFFPVFNEMYRRQRAVFDRMRCLDKSNPVSDADCRRIIQERDKLDLELKKLQQKYHNKLLSVVSEQKVFRALKAENRFHRKMLRRGWGEKK